MKNIAKNILKSAYWFVVILLLTIATIIVFSSFVKNNKLNILTVQSSSMEPGIKTGSVVIVIRAKEYKIGDIITFFNSQNSKSTTTHRINAIEYTEEQTPEYITKGDANDVKDGDKLSYDHILGKVVWAIPYLGYAVKITRTPLGIVFLLIIPAMIYVASEISVIKNELSALRTKK